MRYLACVVLFVLGIVIIFNLVLRFVGNNLANKLDRWVVLIAVFFLFTRFNYNLA